MAIGFGIIHLTGIYIKLISGIPRRRLLSFAGGIAVTYVFMIILPELSESQRFVREFIQNGSESEWYYYIDRHIYLMALAGMIAFYGVERHIKIGKKKIEDKNDFHERFRRKAKVTSIKSYGKKSRTSKFKSKAGKNRISDIEKDELWLFFLHILSFSIYNLIIGYLLIDKEETSFMSLGLYFLGIGLHFYVNDYALRSEHTNLYDSYGRWVLAFAILAGWILGLTTDIDKKAIDIVYAFLAGSIILNVMKEELPKEKESSFIAFFSGAALYAILVLAI